MAESDETPYRAGGPCPADIKFNALRQYLYDAHFHADTDPVVAAHLAEGCRACESQISFLRWTDPVLKVGAEAAVDNIIAGIRIRRVHESREAQQEARALQERLGEPGASPNQDVARELRQELADGIIAALADEDPRKAAEYILQEIDRVAQQDSEAKQKLNQKYDAFYKDLPRSVKEEIDQRLFRHDTEWVLQPNELYCLTVLIASLPAAVGSGKPLITLKKDRDRDIVHVETERLLAACAGR